MAGGFLAYNALLFLRFAQGLYLIRAVLGAAAVVLFLIRRESTKTDQSVWASSVTAAHILCPLALSAFGNGSVFLWLLILAGLAISGLALTDLWDRFGILPAFRGVQRTGLYAQVRHPVYAGYLVSVVGWIGLNPCIQNVCVGIGFVLLTLVRARAEERLLNQSSPEYGVYCQTVKYRLIPGVL